MVEEMIVKMLEQAPSLAVMIWLVYSLRQDVKMLVEHIIELKQQVATSTAESNRIGQ